MNKMFRLTLADMVAALINPGQRCSNRGVTLFEMVIVMGIAAILAAIAIPSFQYVTTSNRIASEINGLLGDLQYARAEAIKEGQTVTVCVSTNGTSCSANDSSWNAGWIVFSDVGNDATVDAGDIVLRVQPQFSGSDTFNTNNNIAAITFNREGFASGGAGGAGFATGTLIVLHTTPVSSAFTRCLSVTMIGLAMTQTYNQTTNGFTCT
jgi:type IV fimbrial biogenesis protein FimT